LEYLSGKVGTEESISEKEFFEIYHNNIKELSSKVNANTTIFTVIEDYKKAQIILKNKNIAIEDEFNRYIFSQILAKIKSIGIKNWELQSREFILYINYLFEEVSKKNRITGEHFKKVFSKEYITSTKKDVVNTLYTAISHFVEILVNTHQYTKTTIEQNSRIGSTYFSELKEQYRSDPIIKSFESIEDFLNAIIQKIIEEGDYKKV